MTNEKTPYIAYTAESLEKLPKARAGDTIKCPHCKESHTLEAGTGIDGSPSELILAYKCGPNVYLGALDGKLVVDKEPDASWEL